MAYFPYFGYIPEPFDPPNFRIDFKIGTEALFINIKAPDPHAAMTIALASLPAYAFVENIERTE